MSDPPSSVSVVLPAAGRGIRLESNKPKAFLSLRGIPLFARSAHPFLKLNELQEFVVVQPNNGSREKEIFSALPDDTPIRVVDGGDERVESVRNGVDALSHEAELVLIHDAARPFVTLELIQRVISTAHEHGAAIAARSIPDTVKRVRDREIQETVDRSDLYRAQTPQGFRHEWLTDALENLFSQQSSPSAYTDDASVVSGAGYPVQIVEGAWFNFKITYPEDLERARQLLDAGTFDTDEFTPL